MASCIYLKTELNPIRHLLSLAGARHFVHVSRIRVKGHTPGKRTAAFVSAMVMERITQIMSEDVQTLKWSYHKNELKAQNVNSTFRVHIFLLSHNNNNNNNNNNKGKIHPITGHEDPEEE
jgi:hypothetical protein